VARYSAWRSRRRHSLGASRGVGGRGKIACCSRSVKSSITAFPGKPDHLMECLKRSIQWSSFAETKEEKWSVTVRESERSACLDKRKTVLLSRQSGRKMRIWLE